MWDVRTSDGHQLRGPCRHQAGVCATIGKLHESEGAEEIVRAVLTIARDLRLSVIAEGVERPAQLERLRALGCKAAQGYLFAPPLPFADIEALLRRGTRIELSAPREASVSVH